MKHCYPYGKWHVHVYDVSLAKRRTQQTEGQTEGGQTYRKRKPYNSIDSCTAKSIRAVLRVHA